MFSPNERHKDGKQSYCTACGTKHLKEYRQTSEHKAVSKKYEESPCRMDSEWRTHIWRKYKISLEQYQQMFDDQQGCCKICRRHQSEFKRRLGVDHCHKTGDVRGILCDDCNRGLGSYKDSEELLLSAIKYLAESKTT